MPYRSFASVRTVVAAVLFPVALAGQQSVHVTGTHVSLVPPPEFEMADRFPGFVGPTPLPYK
jgi:hypothetical protein